MSYSDDDFFVLSSSCQITRGYNRSLIQDFERNISNIISNEYYDLIKEIDRARISDSLKIIDEDSHIFFRKFLDFMFDSEYALFVDNIDFFPIKSDELNDEHVILKDCIIEIDKSNFDTKIFESNLDQLNKLSCEDIQIWLISESDKPFVKKILDIASSYDFLCIELSITNSNNFDRTFLISLLEDYACVSKIFLFDSEKSTIYDYIKDDEGYYPLLIGQLIYVGHPLNANSCGIINFENLSFGVEHQFSVNKKFNGCLYKKLAIDSQGNLKNCPHLEQSFGKQNISEVLKKPLFQKKWLIKKDDIKVCQDCEFRYNCTDCRAFITSEHDDLSKPLKCGYNPYTNVWESWSDKSILKQEVN